MTSTTVIPSPAGKTTTLDPTRWGALAVILIAAFMVLLDTSIVTNALATIQRDLGATYTDVQFVLTAYSVAYGMLLITGGRLGDLYGRKRVFMIGLGGFTLTSALCGLAWSPESLITFRVLQGLSAAVMFPQVSSLIQVLFPVSERPRAFGLQGAVIGLGIVTGPLLGGLLIGANLGDLLWRPIFLVNVPVGLVALVLAARVVPESRSDHAQGLDPFGVILVSTAMFLLTYPVIQGREEGWPVWILVLLASSLPVIVGFFTYQRTLSARGGLPLVEPSLFSDRAFTIGSLITFLFQSGVLSFFVAMVIFLQAGLGFSPLQAAAALMAYQVTTVAASILSARLTSQFGRNVLMLGMVLLAASVAAIMLTLRWVGLSFHGYELVPALVVGGAGFGFVVAPLQNVILARVNPQFAGSASGVLATIQQVGSAVGVAVVGLILFGQLAAGADTASAREIPRLEQSLNALNLPAPAIKAVTTSFRACFSDRSSQRDPSAIPESCHVSNDTVPDELTNPVGEAVASAVTQAGQQNFLGAIQVSLRYQLVVYALCFALVWLLPSAPSAAIRG